MKRNFFTLTYDDSILRLVKINNKKIDSVASANIPAGTVSGGKIQRIQVFSELISSLKNQAKPKKITDNEVIAAVPEEKVFLKTIVIPKVSVDRIQSTIVWQIESIIPFKQTEVYLNWQIIGSVGDKLQILLSVCEKKIIDSLLESLIVAKLKPLIITFPSAGLASMFAPQNVSTLIVNLSKLDIISLIAAKNKNVYLSTSRHFDNDAQKIINIINETIEYHHHKYPDENIKSVVILGPPNLIGHQITEKISQQTKINNLKDIKIINNIKEEYIIYIDNLGLNFDLDELNLLPPEIRNNCANESINYRLSSMLNYFILFIIFIMMIYGLFWGKLYLDTIKINGDYAKVLQDQTNSKQKDLEAQINSFNNKLNIIKNIPFEKAVKPSMIEKIIAKDANITLKKIVIDVNQNVKISGVAKSRNDLIIYKDKLNALGLLNNINLPITALEKKEDVDFELTTTRK